MAFSVAYSSSLIVLAVFRHRSPTLRRVADTLTGPIRCIGVTLNTTAGMCATSLPAREMMPAAPTLSLKFDELGVQDRRVGHDDEARDRRDGRGQFHTLGHLLADLLAKYPGTKEVAFTSFAGEPLYAVRTGDGTTRLISLDGRPIDEINRVLITSIVKQTAQDAAAVEIRVLGQYDRYYLDRTRQQPLPVLLALMNDASHTRYYIDPKTASIVGTYSDRNSARRWLYNGLHSFNFPWLYNYRPLWDIVVIAFMLGGTARPSWFF